MQHDSKLCARRGYDPRFGQWVPTMDRQGTGTEQTTIAVIGGGPAGLMAAETLAASGLSVDVYDRMPTVGRKLLMAGRGGLNITHRMPRPEFDAQYHAQDGRIGHWLDVMDGPAVCRWLEGLGIETFNGSSGKVFPVQMKAAPMLRAWLRRLGELGVRIHVRHRWLGWTDDGVLRFETPDGERQVLAAATVLALGGGSWSRLGSDGRWLPVLDAAGVPVTPLQPANCGFHVDISASTRERHAGEPLKAVALTVNTPDGHSRTRRGECLVTRHGLQGPLVYALSASLRASINAGDGRVVMDLMPDVTEVQLGARLSAPRGKRSVSAHWQRTIGLKGVKADLLRDALAREHWDDPARVARTLKALPMHFLSPRPIDEAISTAGGVALDGVDAALMIKSRPGVFVAGEMLDWDAPTGGYLLTACLASGRVAAQGVIAWGDDHFQGG